MLRQFETSETHRKIAFPFKATPVFKRGNKKLRKPAQEASQHPAKIFHWLLISFWEDIKKAAQSAAQGSTLRAITTIP
jgi:hypothetical protein